MDKRIITEVVINATAEQVWAVLTDFERYPEWNPFIVRIEGALQPGARLTNTLMFEGKPMVFKPTLLEVIPSKAFSWRGSLWVKGLFDGVHFFRIETTGNGQVLLTQGETFTGIFSALIFKKIGAATRNNFIKMNSALRTRCEALATHTP